MNSYKIPSGTNIAQFLSFATGNVQVGTVSGSDNTLGLAAVGWVTYNGINFPARILTCMCLSDRQVAWAWTDQRGTLFPVQYFSGQAFLRLTASANGIVTAWGPASPFVSSNTTFVCMIGGASTTTLPAGANVTCTLAFCPMSTQGTCMTISTSQLAQFPVFFDMQAYTAQPIPTELVSADGCSISNTPIQKLLVSSASSSLYSASFAVRQISYGSGFSPMVSLTQYLSGGVVLASPAVALTPALRSAAEGSTLSVAQQTSGAPNFLVSVGGSAATLVLPAPSSGTFNPAAGEMVLTMTGDAAELGINVYPVDFTTTPIPLPLSGSGVCSTKTTPSVYNLVNAGSTTDAVPLSLDVILAPYEGVTVSGAVIGYVAYNDATGSVNAVSRAIPAAALSNATSGFATRRGVTGTLDAGGTHIIIVGLDGNAYHEPLNAIQRERVGYGGQGGVWYVQVDTQGSGANGVATFCAPANASTTSPAVLPPFTPSPGPGPNPPNPPNPPTPDYTPLLIGAGILGVGAAAFVFSRS